MRIYNEDFDIILKRRFPFLNDIVATEKGFGAFFEYKYKERFIKVIYEEYEKDNNGLSLLEYIDEKIGNVKSDVDKQLNRMYEEATKKPNNKQYYLDKAFKYADDDVLEVIETGIKNRISILRNRDIYDKKTGKTSALVFLSLSHNIPLIVKSEEEKDYLKKEYPILEVYSINEYNTFEKVTFELIVDEAFDTGSIVLSEMDKNFRKFYGLCALN